MSKTQSSKVFTSEVLTFIVYSGKYPFRKIGAIEAKDAQEAIDKVKGNWHQWHEVRPAVRSLDGSYEAAVEANAFAPEEEPEYLM